MSRTSRMLLTAVALLAACGLAHASGAGFRLSAVGADLGKADDEGAEIPRYRVRVKVGDTLTLVADGVVMPRGAPPAPGDIDAGAWLFDDEAFKLVPADRAKAGKQRAVVALQSLKPGTSRVRFVGDILGHYRRYDVLVEAVAP